MVAAVPEDVIADCPEHLSYVTDTCPGYLRRRAGRGFRYVCADGKPLKDAATLARIKALVIPPQWQQVWICADAAGHLQATGLDTKGRKQYLYHADWVSYRQLHKFSRLYDFGMALPAIRRRLATHLSRSEWDKQKALAVVVTLMDRHFLRVGNTAYADENDTYGATTLQKEHLVVEGGQMALHFRAKSGKIRHVDITSRRLKRLIGELSELPGQEIFRYMEAGESHPLTSADVNLYLKEISGQNFSAKNFRTWGGTVTALEVAEEAAAEVAANPRRKLERVLVSKVADRLGNTVAVCREYYIHPRILELACRSEHLQYQNQSLPDPTCETLAPAEQLALKILATV